MSATFSGTSLPPTIRVSDSGRAPLVLWPGTIELRPKNTFTVLRTEPVEFGLREQITALANLPEDWDSYGGGAPSRAVLDAAWRFLVDLNERARNLGLEIGEPKLLAGGDGTIGFIWRHPDEDSSLEVVVHERGADFVASRRGVITEGVLESPEEALPLLAW